MRIDRISTQHDTFDSEHTPFSVPKHVIIAFESDPDLLEYTVAHVHIAATVTYRRHEFDA